MKPEENINDEGVPMVTVGTKDGVVTRPATPAEIERQDKIARKDTIEPLSHITGTGELKNLSPARRRLQLLRKAEPGINTTPLVPVEAEGEQFFLRRLDFAGLTRLGMLTPRDKNGMLDVANPASLKSLTTAMLFCAVADEKGADFFESYQEAYEWASDRDPGIIRVLSVLFHNILGINPDILPGNNGKKPTPEQEEAVEKKDESGETAAPENPTSS